MIRSTKISTVKGIAILKIDFSELKKMGIQDSVFFKIVDLLF